MRGASVRAVVWVVGAAQIIGAAAAQEAPEPPQPVTLSVEAGFGGRIKQEKWAPIRCIVENRSGGQLRGTLSIVLPADAEKEKHTYYAPIDLPSPSRRRFTLYVHPQQYIDRVAVRLNAGDVRLTQTIPVMTLYGGNATALVLSKGPVGLFAAARRPEFGGLEVVSGDIADLPEKPAGYELVDVIFYNGLSLRNFASEQEQALRQWLLEGGALIVATGRHWQLVKGTALERLLPVTLLGSAPTTRPAPRSWTDYFGGLQFPGPLVLARGRPIDGATVLIGDTRSGVPLIVSRDVGLGRVVYLAFDLSAPAVLLSPEHSNLYRDLLQWTHVIRRQYAYPWGSFLQGPAWGRSAMRQQAVYQTPVARAPSLFWVIVFLGIYVVAIGPLDYFVLKRLRRRHLTVITFPVMVLAFTGASYYFASSFKGRQVFINEISIVRQRGEYAHVGTHFGVYSPRQATYSIAVKEPTATVLPLEEPAAAEEASRRARRRRAPTTFVLPRASGGAIFSRPSWAPYAGVYPEEVAEEARVMTGAFTAAELSEAFRLPDISIDMWAMRTFYADWWLRVGRIEGRLKYDSGEHRIAGQVANGTRYDLEDCLLIFRGAAEPLGDLPAGGSTQVSAAFPPDGYRTTYPEEELIGGIDAEERKARRATLESLGLLPYNMDELAAEYSRLRAAAQRMGDLLCAVGPIQEFLAPMGSFAQPVVIGWTREPLLPIEIEGRRAGRRAVNMWVLQPEASGLPERHSYVQAPLRRISPGSTRR